MKITLDDIVSGFKSVTKIIANFGKIEDDLNNKVLYRDNPTGEPNQMENNLDMNSQRIVNLVAPVNDSEPARWADVKNGVTGIDEPVPSQTGNAKTPLTTNGTGLVFGQIEADHVDFTNSGTGGVERTLQAKLEDVVSVKDFGAVGDGVTDDTQAFIDAFTVSRNVYCANGTTYAVSNLSIPTNTYLNGNGCVFKRAGGTGHVLKLSGFGATATNFDMNLQNVWQSSTVNGAVSAASTEIIVADSSGFAAGQQVFFESDVEYRIECIEIGSVDSDTHTLTLKRAVDGNITSGVKILADYAGIVVSNSIMQRLTDIKVRQSLVGIQFGETGFPAGNTWWIANNININGCLGAGIVYTHGGAAETMSNYVINTGYTQTVTYTGEGTGSKTRWDYPYALSNYPYRWGAEPSIRVWVDGVKLDTADYTLDTGTSEVVITTPPPLGVDIKVQNYEYGAYGIHGSNVDESAPESNGRFANSLIITANVGVFGTGCGLFFMNHTQIDSCGYAACYFKDTSRWEFSDCSFLFSPFGVRTAGGNTKIAFSGISTSLIPSSAEFVPTSDRTEIYIGSGDRDDVKISDWVSSNGYQSYAPQVAIADFHNLGGSFNGVTLTRASDDASGALFQGRHSRGTEASKSPTLNNDVIAHYRGASWNGNGWQNVGEVRMRATENHSPTNEGTGVELVGTPQGTTSTAILAAFEHNSSGLVQQVFDPSGDNIKIVIGSGVPTVSAANGSLFLRTDGTGPNLYVRENAAWVSK